MSELTQLTLALFAGMALGAIFFGGLWWTVRKGLASARPAQWFLGSLAARMGIALGGFYFAADGDWRRMVACLCGFVAVRLVVIRLAAMPAPGEGSHAP